MRQAFAGLLWSKQLYYYDVARWLDGDPGQPPPSPQRREGRNARWRGFDAFDIMSMPDKWEYPWFAAWDLAFHAVALAHVDPAFAKYQLILLCREWFQHPNGALPAYEWDFSDVNPPVQAWAALEVFAVDEGRDVDVPVPGLRQAADQLHLVGQPGGRGGQQPVRGRLPRPGQHRAARPLAPAARRPARAVRRHRLDGRLRHGPVRHRRRAQPVQAAARRRPGAEVPRALRRHPRRPDQPGPVGRGGRPVLRPDRAAGRHRGAGAGPLDGRHDPGPGRRGGGRERPAAGPDRGQAVRQPAGPRRPGRPRRPARAGHAPRPGGPAEAPAQPGRAGPAAAAHGPAVRRERVPVPARAPGAVRLPPRAPVPDRGRRASRPASTTSPPSPPRRCSAGTPTGAGRSGSR